MFVGVQKAELNCIFLRPTPSTSGLAKGKKARLASPTAATEELPPPRDSLSFWLWKKASVEHDWRCAKNRIFHTLLPPLFLLCSFPLALLRRDSLAQSLSRPQAESEISKARLATVQRERERERERPRRRQKRKRTNTLHACVPDSLSLWLSLSSALPFPLPFPKGLLSSKEEWRSLSQMREIRRRGERGEERRKGERREIIIMMTMMMMMMMIETVVVVSGFLFICFCFGI